MKPTRATVILMTWALAALTGCTTDAGVLAIHLQSGERASFSSESEIPEGWAVCPEDECPPVGPCDGLGETDCTTRVDCMPVVEHPATTPDPAFVRCAEAGECDPISCGPGPLGATYQCDDGSQGGVTGRCLPIEGGGCGWEVRDCPMACQPSDCGPPLGLPSYQCDDGSIGGDTGQCIATEEGCAWEVRDCPDSCDPSDCGPRPGAPTYLCGDGSVGGNTGACIRSGTDCVWEQRECPPVECRPDDCGIAPGAAPQCSDGTTANTVCQADPGGECNWQFLCPGTA